MLGAAELSDTAGGKTKLSPTLKNLRNYSFLLSLLSGALAATACGDNVPAGVEPEPSANCGDGVVDANEVCDDGNNVDGDGCAANCASDETCGNGVVDSGESCEDGNTVGADGCSATCVSEFCGNSQMDGNESCDDGNTADGDGCSATCASDETCGNSVIDGGEDCDDGNTEDGDGCAASCATEFCDNGLYLVGGGCDDGSTTIPEFSGIKSAATAGGATAVLTWDAGFDNETAVANLVYRVYASATPGGQDFTSPVFTTAAGALSATITDAESPLLAMGANVHFVVRAVDGDGNEDSNVVEASTIFFAPANVAYVSSTATGTGTLGDVTDPYLTIQAGVLAVEAAGGGAVLVDADAAGTTYTEEVDLSGTVSSITLMGGFSRFSALAAGATSADVLASRDVSGNVTTVSALGLILTDTDLVRVNNGGSPTLIDGFTFADLTSTNEPAIGALDASIQVSNCTFAENSAFWSETSDLLTTSNIRLVGNDVTGEGAVFAAIGGVVRSLEMYNNKVELRDALETTATAQLALFVPTSGSRVYFENNEIRNGDADPIRLTFQPATPAAGGDLDLRIEHNYVRDNSSNAFDINGFSEVGDGGSASLIFRDNLIVGVGSDGIDLDFQNGTIYADVGVDVLISDNEILGSNSIPVDIDLGVSGNSTTRVVITDNFISGSESELFEITDSSGPIDSSNGGNIEILVARNTSFGAEDLEIEVGPTHGGITDIRVFENTTLGSEDEGLNIDIQNHLGTSTVVPTFPDGLYFVNIFNNDIHGGDDEALEFRDSRSSTGNESAAFAYLGQNYLADSPDPSSAVGIDLAFSRSNAWMLMERNFIGVGGADSEDAVRLATGASGLGGEIQFSNNVFTLAHGSGVELNSTGVAAQMVNNTLSFNGENTQYGIGVNGTSSSQAFIHNSIISHNSRGDLDEGLSASYSLIGDGENSAGLGNIDGDPIFAVTMSDLPFPQTVDSQLAFIYTLESASPAIDSGDPKVMYNDPDGTRNDMGAYGGPGAGSMGFTLANTPLPLAFLGTSPTVNLFSGSLMVADTDAITLAFNQPINDASLAAGITFSNNGSAVAGALTSAAGGRLVTFTPTTTLTSGADTLVEINLTTMLTSASGENLSYPVTRRFGVVQAAAAETEPNDDGVAGFSVADITNAQALVASASSAFSQAGELTSNVDEDVYTLSATAGARLKVTSVYSRTGGVDDGNIALSLYDATGALVHLGTTGVFLTDAYLDVTLAADGDYYLVVSNPTSTALQAYDLQGMLD